MRCPSCGTQNEPDSRFCGGCGARLSGTLAPTQKIHSDDPMPAPQAPSLPSLPSPSMPVPQRTPLVQQPSPFAQPRHGTTPTAAQREQQSQPQIKPPPVSQQQARQPSAQQYAQGPNSQQQTAQRAPSAPQPIPPSAQQSIPRPRTPSAQRSAPVAGASAPYAPARVSPRDGASPVSSGPVARGSVERSAERARSGGSIEPLPKRRWGLIIVVLVFDLGLAAAGAYLLNEGLSVGQPPPKSDPAPGSATVKTGDSEQRPAAVATDSAPKPTPVAIQQPTASAGSGSANPSGSGSGSGAPTAATGSASPTTATDNGSGSATTTPPRDTAQGRKPKLRPGPTKGGGKPIDPYDDNPAGPPAGPPPPPAGPPQGPPLPPPP